MRKDVPETEIHVHVAHTLYRSNSNGKTVKNLWALLELVFGEVLEAYHSQVVLSSQLSFLLEDQRIFCG